jgi:hypothetical protein
MNKIKIYFIGLGVLLISACVDINPIKGTYHGTMIYSDTAYVGAQDTALAIVEIWESNDPNEINLKCSFDTINFECRDIDIWCNDPSYIYLGGGWSGINGFIINNDSLNYSCKILLPHLLYTRFAGAK